MSIKIPPYIILHKTREVIFYIPNNFKDIDTELWRGKLRIINYKVMIIKSKCIFNRLKGELGNEI